MEIGFELWFFDREVIWELEVGDKVEVKVLGFEIGFEIGFEPSQKQCFCKDLMLAISKKLGKHICSKAM